jgi:hypothetical protein
MEARDWIALVGIVTTGCVATLLLSHRRERQQQARDDRLRDEARAREDKLRAAERALVPRTRVDLDCRFVGPEQGRYLAEVLIIVDNTGRVRRSFKHMNIRLRGILADTPLQRWKERDECRLKFPEPIAKADIVPPGEHYYYVEPGVRQTFTYVTDVPATVRYVLAHIKLEAMPSGNDDLSETIFTEERLYILKPEVIQPPAQSSRS